LLHNDFWKFFVQFRKSFIFLFEFFFIFFIYEFFLTKEIFENEINRKTNSLWHYLQPETYKNQFYENSEGDYLIPDTSIGSLKLWEEWFMYHTKVFKKNCCKNPSEFYQYKFIF